MTMRFNKKGKGVRIDTDNHLLGTLCFILIFGIPGICIAGGLYLNELVLPAWGLPVREPMPWPKMPLPHFTMPPG